MKTTAGYSTLFVCSANQCRSPMAEALCKQYIIYTSPDLEEKWSVASAGCWAYRGMPATTRALTAVETLGTQLIDHSSQPVTADLLEKFKLVLCMEYGHVDFIKRHFSEVSDRVFLFSEMIGEEFEIEDPIGKTQSDYDASARKINAIIQNGWARISELSAS